MAKFRLDKFKPLVALGLFLVAWWIVPTLSKSFLPFLRVSFTEFQAPAWIVTSYLDDLEEFWARRSHSKIELIEAGQTLARQKAFYQLLDQRNNTLETEVMRLETILNMPSRREFRYEVARVIRRDLSAWWQQIVIRKGDDYGITEGAAVIFAGGVVGRVIEVNAFTSRVELITSPNFRMAASFEGDDRPVVFQGVPQSGFGAPTGAVRDAPQDLVANTHEPLQLISTRLGGTFPPGLIIGKVGWLEPGSSGIFQAGEVQLDERLLSLHEVSVLIPLTPLVYDRDVD
ncbi:MAG: rod shape-determining protein MreC [Opitutae bacterium]|nr:rod shape-determining protein MreC [Opitutales bacterium]MDA9589660.1 rod shape-determining protein MreC [Opitutales bacterium]MDB2357936.1 rod shape-determining protein MreC [Opitutales bacterium]MDG1668417.1 rod shape-determining protein MreC [Opitutae bacterium]MDG2345604.1 rod shape-determining protein MreC [Opitutae bacterium]